MAEKLHSMKKIVVLGVAREDYLRAIADELQKALGESIGVRVEIQDMTNDEYIEYMQRVMNAGPNEMFGRTT